MVTFASIIIVMIINYVIEEYISEFIDIIVKYDYVVNQFFLPMFKQKIKGPKKDIGKEIKKQKDKFTIIRDAYVNEVFNLEEYNTRQTMGNRKIKDYFAHISKNSKRGLFVR